MKLKKPHIFLICYYAAFAVALTVMAILLKDQLQFNGWSTFPICYILAFILWMWYCQTDTCKERLYWDGYWRQRRYKKISISDYDKEVESRRNPEREKADDRLRLFISFLGIPLFTPFVFFGNYLYKIFSFLIVLAPYFTIVICWLLFTDPENKEIKAEREKRKQELKEQQQREELGKWK